jgi:hypothetical protein
VREVGLNRATPAATYEYLKAMVGANQVDAEWHSFSPGFKRRLSERAGRNVDVGDYGHARATIASNATKEIAMLLSSELVSEEKLSDSVAVLTIRSGSRQASPRFVKLTTWELRLKGEGQPVEEFIPRAADVVGISREGSVSLRVTPSTGTAAFLKDIPTDRIEELHVTSEWYLDDFGGVEDAVVGGLGASPARGTPPPPAPTPAPPGTGSPQGDPGSPG